MKLNFESLEMQKWIMKMNFEKWIMLMGRTQRVDDDLFSCFHVYSRNYGLYI